MPRLTVPVAAGLALALALGACTPPSTGTSGVAAAPAAPAAKSAETADQFIARVNADLQALGIELNAAGFTQQTYINTDTEFLSAKAQERYDAYLAQAIEESKRFDSAQLSPVNQRMLMKLRLNASSPAPSDPAKRARLTQLSAQLEGLYGSAKSCPQGPASCKNLDQLSDVLSKSRNYDELTATWKGWHDVGITMRPDYVEFVGLVNEGARELGYKDLGVMWRAGYDMPPEAFDADAERLWQQVKPLYDGLHCYARAKLAKRYGEARVPAGKPIPAQLFGDMWAQEWTNIYPDILMPYPAARVETADAQLKAQKWDAQRITRSAESFYTSMGFPALPKTFWERSMFVRPRDREVVCHAEALDMAPGGDVRIKVCLEPTGEDLYTAYHELGHDYYFLSYAKQPFLFRDGANDGFHEAIGDTINLSVTPAYLAQIGLIKAVKPSHEALINQQMKIAADKIAFLPFGRVIDLWRWKVFSGEIKPENYNSTWWALRQRYQGIAPPVARSESDFDPAAKYHVADNTPYTRYFLSFILQFQFHKALCQASGFKGPLYECSNFNSKEAGKRFAEMMSAGASQPWQDTLEKLTGTRDIDASAITEYFQPLSEWLAQENKGQDCSWQADAPVTASR